MSLEKLETFDWLDIFAWLSCSLSYRIKDSKILSNVDVLYFSRLAPLSFSPWLNLALMTLKAVGQGLTCIASIGPDILDLRYLDHRSNIRCSWEQQLKSISTHFHCKIRIPISYFRYHHLFHWQSKHTCSNVPSAHYVMVLGKHWQELKFHSSIISP